jgi:hypothetical protein
VGEVVSLDYATRGHGLVGQLGSLHDDMLGEIARLEGRNQILEMRLKRAGISATDEPDKVSYQEAVAIVDKLLAQLPVDRAGAALMLELVRAQALQSIATGIDKDVIKMIEAIVPDWKSRVA